MICLNNAVGLKCQFDQIFQSLCLWIFRKFMQRLLTTPSRFSTRVLKVRFFSHGISRILCPPLIGHVPTAVRVMGPVTSNS